METAKYELPAGVKLVCSAAFWPEGRWYFVQDLPVPLVWGRTTGWKKYYEADRADSYLWTREEAMKAWQEAGH